MANARFCVADMSELMPVRVESEAPLCSLIPPARRHLAYARGRGKEMLSTVR